MKDENDSHSHTECKKGSDLREYWWFGDIHPHMCFQNSEYHIVPLAKMS